MVDTTVTLMPPRDLLYFVTTTQTKPFVRNRSHCLLSNAHKDCTTKHKGPLSDAFDLRFNARGRGPPGRMNTYGQVQTPLGSARSPTTLRFGSATKVFRFSCVHPAIVRSLTAVQYPIHGNYTMVMVDQYNQSLNLTYRPSATEPGGRKSDVHLLIKDPTHPSKPVSNLLDFHFFRSNR